MLPDSLKIPQVLREDLSPVKPTVVFLETKTCVIEGICSLEFNLTYLSFEVKSF